MRHSRIKIPVSGSTDNLTVTPVESVSDLSSPAITQIHALTSVSVESLSELTTPSITQTHSLTNISVESASEVSQPNISQSHTLTAAGVESASNVSNPVVTDVSGTVLDAVDVESASEVTNPVIGQTHVITASDVESASEAGIPSVTQVHALTALSVESSSEVSSPVAADAGQIYVTDYPATAYFPTGQTDVTIEVFSSTDGSSVSLSSNSCREVGSSGLYVWDSANLATQPTGLTSYLFKMTDGSTTTGGTLFVFDQTATNQVNLIYQRLGLDSSAPVTNHDTGGYEFDTVVVEGSTSGSDVIQTRTS